MTSQRQKQVIHLNGENTTVAPQARGYKRKSTIGRLVRSLSSNHDVSNTDSRRPRSAKPLSHLLSNSSTTPVSTVNSMFGVPLKEEDFRKYDLLKISSMTPKQTLHYLDTNQGGLSAMKSDERLERFGRNELPKEPLPWFIWLFIQQFNDPTVILLLVSGILAGILGDEIASIVLCTILFANAMIGAVQEWLANKGIRALNDRTASTWQVVTSYDDQSGTYETDNQDPTKAVPGTVVRLQVGDTIYADVRVISCSEDFKTNEAMLTGESELVNKQVTGKDNENPSSISNIVYSGTLVGSGSAVGVVVNTATNTVMAGIRADISVVEEAEGPLAKKMDKLGKQLAIASILACLVVFIIGGSTGRGGDPNSDQNIWLQMTLVSVSLIAAAVPEGLPIVMTITLAAGMKIMAASNALVRKLEAAQILGSVTVVNSDKTGTITEGNMTAQEIVFPTGSVKINSGRPSEIGFQYDDAFAADFVNAALILKMCCKGKADWQVSAQAGSWKITGNLTDGGIDKLRQSKLFKEMPDLQGFREVSCNEFNSSRKMMSVLVEKDGKFYSLVKGAPEYVARACATEELDPDKFSAQIGEIIKYYTSKGIRAIGLAMKEVKDSKDASLEALESDLTWCGFITLRDPPREGVRDAIATMHSAGVRVVMITGDCEETGGAIAHEVGIGQDRKDNPVYKKNGPHVTSCRKTADLFDAYVALSKKKKKEDLSNEESTNYDDLCKKVDTVVAWTDVFARARPQDKLAILESEIRAGEITAMTGDGVNDSPACRQSHIGIAMGTGADLLKNVAEMVLTDDNFCTIVKAIKEGRRIYTNIGKFVYFLLSTNVAEVTLFVLTTIIGLPVPMTPIQILWVNLMTDSLPALALGFEKIEDNVMNMPPILPNVPIVTRNMWKRIAVHAVFMTMYLTGLYVGVLHHATGKWNGKDASEEDLSTAQTMTILIIVLTELTRSYSCKNYNNIKIAYFDNSMLNKSVLGAIVLTLTIALIPGVKKIFDMGDLSGIDWTIVIASSPALFLFDIIVKLIFREPTVELIRTGTGLVRQNSDITQDDLARPSNKQKKWRTLDVEAGYGTEYSINIQC